MLRRLTLILSLLLATSAAADTELFSNGARTTLGASINASTTAITVAAGTGGQFPAVTATTYYKIIVCASGAVASSACEIMTCTTHAAASATMTCARGQDSTTAASWLATAQVRMNVLASTLGRYEAASADARTPTAHAASHLPGGTDALTTASAAANPPGTASSAGVAASFARSDHTHALGAFGTTGGTFCQGDDARIPIAGEKAALAGTSGTPGSGNKYVTDGDSRNANARTPTAHASSHLSVGSDPITVAGSVFTAAGGLTVAEGLSLAGIASYSLSASVNDLAITGANTASTLFITPSASTWSVTGLVAPTAGAGAYYVLRNPSTTNYFTLPHESASSAAANRIACPGGTSYIVGPRDGVIIRYGGDARWHPIAPAMDGAAGVPGARSLGTGAAQAAAGNDSRLSDARAPTAHASTHLPGGSDALTTAAAGTSAFNDAASAGSASSFARSDHKHAVAAVPGSSTEIQYRSSATALGAAGKVRVETGGRLQLTEEGTPTTNTATAVASAMLLEAKSGISQSAILTIIPPTGEGSVLGISPIMRALHKPFCWLPGAGSTLGSEAISNNQDSGTTVSHPNPTTTNYSARQPRFRVASSASAGHSAGFYIPTLKYWRGNAAGLGGFRVVMHNLILSTSLSGQRSFFGLRGSGGAIGLTAEPDSLTDIIGVCQESTDTTLHECNNDGSGTASRPDFGSDFPLTANTQAYDVEITAFPNDTHVYVDVIRKDTAKRASMDIATNIPASTTYLAPATYTSNGATASSAAFDLGYFCVYELGDE